MSRTLSPLMPPALPLSPSRNGWQPLGVAFAVTILAGASTLWLPGAWAANLVGLLFFAATYALVLRHDATTIVEHGLGLGGLFEPEPLSWSRMVTDTGRALAWASVAGLAFLPAFALGYAWWWQPRSSYHFTLGESPLSDVVTQVVAVALPEEMFYRGYLQSELEKVWPPVASGWLRGAGAALVITSLVFAAGHLVTIPHAARLAVFFPSLVFGWLRARTGGIGAGVLFHALCNLFALNLGRGYGFFP